MTARPIDAETAHRRHFYVDIVRGRRVGLLAGPFADHDAAIAALPDARRAAIEADAFAVFDLIGTMSFVTAAPPAGVFNRQLGIGG